jgi:hypothetical protein
MPTVSERVGSGTNRISEVAVTLPRLRDDTSNIPRNGTQAFSLDLDLKGLINACRILWTMSILRVPACSDALPLTPYVANSQTKQALVQRTLQILSVDNAQDAWADLISGVAPLVMLVGERVTDVSRGTRYKATPQRSHVEDRVLHAWSNSVWPNHVNGEFIAVGVDTPGSQTYRS